MNRRHRQSALEVDPEELETIWQKLSRVTLALILVAALGVAFTFFIPELERQKNLNRDINQLKQDREVAATKRDTLRRELRWLNDDPEYLEIRARDLANLYKKGETILRIEPDGESPN